MCTFLIKQKTSINIFLVANVKDEKTQSRFYDVLGLCSNMCIECWLCTSGSGFLHRWVLGFASLSAEIALLIPDYDFDLNLFVQIDMRLQHNSFCIPTGRYIQLLNTI